MKRELADYLKLKELALSWGASLCGGADISHMRGEFLYLPEELTRKLEYGISIGFRLSESVLATVKDRPTQIYFHHYRQVNYFLDSLALRITGFIQEKGALALPVPASQVVDRERQRGHLSHRKVACLAGLGWIGRNNLLVTPDFGAGVRLATVLTNLPVPEQKPGPASGCKDCVRCIDLCPAGAIKEDAGSFDRKACFTQLEKFRKTCAIGHHICGVCVSACPGKRLIQA